MTITQVLDHLRAEKIAIRLEQDLVILSPAQKVTEELRAAVGHHKPDLVWLLQHRTNRRGDDPHEIFLTEKANAEWTWRKSRAEAMGDTSEREATKATLDGKAVATSRDRYGWRGIPGNIATLR